MSAGSSNFWAFSAASPPVAGPNESAAKTATSSTAAAWPRTHAMPRGQPSGSNVMPGIDFYTASFLEDHREEIYAVVTLVLAFVTARAGGPRPFASAASA